MGELTDYVDTVVNETATVGKAVTAGSLRAITVGALPVIWISLVAGVTILLISLPARLMKLE